jgi:2-keto-3-deoxy-L-rhamnonate aldolase RhmA
MKQMLDDRTRPYPGDFRKRLSSGERLVGTFIKTPSSHTTEIIGEAGFDFAIIDQEHAPFDRAATDVALLAAQATRIAGMVRVPALDAAQVLAALDDGAIGVIAPHIDTADKAKQLVAFARYGNGRRGFSNSPRAGRYGGRDIATHVAGSDTQTTVIAMIEDAEALDHIEAIVSVEGLDAILIGRADLTVSLGEDMPGAPTVQNAIERICAAARKASLRICVPINNAAERDAYSRLGATLFAVATDQLFLRRAAEAALSDIKGV